MRKYRTFRQVSPRGVPSSWLRLTWLAALLVALSWQSVILQSHNHLAATPMAGTEHQAGRSPGEHRSPLAPDNCPICDEIDVAGVYLLGAAVILLEPPYQAFWYTAEEQPRSIDGEPAHHWRSRAPPLQPLI